MTNNDAIVALFLDQPSAKAVVRRLDEGWLDTRQFSIVGKGYHTEKTMAPSRLDLHSDLSPALGPSSAAHAAAA